MVAVVVVALCLLPFLSRFKIASAERSVVVLKDAKGLCGGVIIEGDKILTAGHCADGNIEFVQEINGHESLAFLVKVDHVRDLALFEDEALQSPALPIAEITPDKGDKVWMIGHPLGQLWSISAGHISNVINDTGTSWLQLDFCAVPGNSGGPILSTDGKIIGIVSHDLLQNRFGAIIPQLSYAADLGAIHKFLWSK